MHKLSYGFSYKKQALHSFFRFYAVCRLSYVIFVYIARSRGSGGATFANIPQSRLTGGATFAYIVLPCGSGGATIVDIVQRQGSSGTKSV